MENLLFFPKYFGNLSPFILSDSIVHFQIFAFVFQTDPKTS
jgi:hypothetical protein